MAKIYFEFSRQMIYLVSTMFNHKFVVVVEVVVVVVVVLVVAAAVVVVEVAVVVVFVVVATFVAKSLEKWERSVVNWEFC